MAQTGEKDVIYDVLISQRDSAWKELDRLRDEYGRLYDESCRIDRALRQSEWPEPNGLDKTLVCKECGDDSRKQVAFGFCAICHRPLVLVARWRREASLSILNGVD